MRRGWTVWVTALAIACGGGSPPPAAAPKQPSKPASARPETARDRLAAELRKIPRAPDVLAALDAQSRADIRKIVDSLSPQERRELARADTPWPRARPLLHLAAGGDAPDAFYELATTASASQELVAARQRAGGALSKELITSARGVVERSAARWLRDRAVEVASPSDGTAALCDRIDRAAAALDRDSTRRRAREFAVELDPSPQRWTAVAHAAAWQLDLPAAREALDKARKLARDPALGARVQAAARALADAERVQESQGKKLDPEQAVSVARASLRIGRNRDAERVIAPHHALAASHLGVATVEVLANHRGIICPGLPPGAQHPLLCAISWSSSSEVKDAQAAVERAWAAGGGRDEEAIGAYLGLAHFVPWIYFTYELSSSGGDPNRAFRERIGGVRKALAEAVRAAPQFAGVSLFVDTLAGLYEAGQNKQPGERVRLPAAAANELVARATALAKQSPDHRFTHAGILAVATALTQERDVTPIVALLPDELGAEYAVVAQILRLWAAVGAQDREALTRSADAIATLVSAQSDPLRSATAILLVSEARAAVLDGERDHDVLSRVAAQLSSRDVPAELRLRAAIDRAGSLARANQQQQAEQLLETVVREVAAAPGSSEADLATIANAYRLVLRARAASGDERKALRDELAKVFEGPGAAQLPASILAWRDLWLRALDRAIAGDACGAMKACPQRDRLPGSLSDSELAGRVGKAAADVMKSGVLAVGSMHLNFAFSAEEGLTPVVLFEPRLLGVELPRQRRDRPR